MAKSASETFAIRKGIMMSQAEKILPELITEYGNQTSRNSTRRRKGENRLILFCVLPAVNLMFRCSTFSAIKVVFMIAVLSICPAWIVARDDINWIH